MRHVIIYCTLVFASFCLSAMADEFAVVARVNDKVITEFDLTRRMNFVKTAIKAGLFHDNEEKLQDDSQVKKLLLDIMITELIELAEAEKNGITIDDVVVEKEISEIETKMGLDQGWISKFIKNNKLEKEDYYQQIRAKIAWSEFVMQVLRHKVDVSDVEINDAYELGLADQAREKILLETMLIPDKDLDDRILSSDQKQKLIKNLIDEMSNGVEMSRIGLNPAYAHFNLQYNKPSWYELNQLEKDPEIYNMIQHAKAGDKFYSPVKNGNGYVMFNIIRRISLRDYSIEDLAISIKYLIFNKAPTAAFFAKLKRKNCANFDQSATKLDNIKIRNLSPELRFTAYLKENTIGVNYDFNGKVIVAMSCRAAELKPNQTEKAELKSLLLTHKLDSEANRYLRTLRATKIW